MSVDSRILALVASIGTRSESWIVEEVMELADAGEQMVAFEALCDHVYEVELPLFDGEVCEIEALGAFLASVSPFPDRGVWKLVRELLAKDEVSDHRRI